VVVVENVLALPLHLEAAGVLTGVLAGLPAGTRVLLHHHDLAWQRPETAAITELPPRLPGAVHVTINDFSRRELAERGIEAVTVRNAFDLDAPPGRRAETRAALGVGPDELLVLQPTRAIARKNIPAALRLAEALADRLDRPVRFWLPGPAEDGYAATLAEVLAGTPLPVLRDRPPAMGDAYAASDLVTFPSTGGEGFGQPVIESVWADRPLAVLRYPALDEILALGFSFLPADDPEAVAAALREGWERDGPGPAAARNRRLAEEHFSMAALEGALGALLGTG
jgi:glycosyltransferase involved in cell wall biosynthesis